MTTCTYHCGACGTHFHSLKAFDAHRQGSFAAPTGWAEARHCVHPHDLGSRLMMLTEDGECRVHADVKRGVTIWTLRSDYDRIPWRKRP